MFYVQHNPTLVTIEEGGAWHLWKPGEFKHIHAAYFKASGMIWDSYNGWRIAGAGEFFALAPGTDIKDI